MDADPSARATRKFTPKKLGPRKNRTAQSKLKLTEEAMEVENAEEEIPENLIRRVNEHLAREKPISDKKAKQVAFTHGVTQLRTFGKPREQSAEGDGAASRSLELVNKQNYLSVTKASRNSGVDEKLDLLSLPSTAETDGVDESPPNEPSQKPKPKDYKEPWDYHHSYYPISLPLRRPFFGDPELLDKAEFGKAATSVKYNEDSINAASDLGLLEEAGNPRLLFLQLPSKLPKTKPVPGIDGRETTERRKGEGTSTATSTIAKGKEISGSSGKRTHSIGECSLEDLPKGYMGKMLVYKSGAVKLKLGDILYDVSAGSDGSCAQDVVAVNTASKHCCVIGELGKRAVVTPDTDFLLNASNQHM